MQPLNFVALTQIPGSIDEHEFRRRLELHHAHLHERREARRDRRRRIVRRIRAMRPSRPNRAIALAR